MLSDNRQSAQNWPLQRIQGAIPRLIALAVSGLMRMFDPEKQLFCYRLKLAHGRLVQNGTSQRYTVISLMGLHRLEQRSAPSRVDVKSVLDRLLANTDWVDNIGDLGLLLWLGAQVAPHRLGELDRRFRISTALTRFADARQRMTTGLAWFLTGLSYYSPLSDNPEKIRDVARETYNLLIRNQGQHGYFGHMDEHHSLTGSVRGRIGNFADQVYPIYGMTQFSQAYADDSALRRARQCALAICEAQGPLGQWWWLYDSRSGRTFEEYPVFSVHQHGMGPMALFALSKAAELDFDPSIYKGLDWINRHNELSADMEDASASVIWRCIRQSALRRYSRLLLHTYRNGRNGQHSGSDGLSVLFECRPYELGWLLYGLADLLHKPVSTVHQVDASSSVT